MRISLQPVSKNVDRMIESIYAMPRPAFKEAAFATMGRSRVVRLAKEFRFKGTEVKIRKEGCKIRLEPSAVNKLARRGRKEDISSKIAGYRYCVFEVITGVKGLDFPSFSFVVPRDIELAHPVPTIVGIREI